MLDEANMKISVLDSASLRPTLKASWHNKSNVGRNCCPISIYQIKCLFIFRANVAQYRATCRSSSQAVILKMRLLQHVTMYFTVVIKL